MPVFAWDISYLIDAIYGDFGDVDRILKFANSVNVTEAQNLSFLEEEIPQEKHIQSGTVEDPNRVTRRADNRFIEAVE